VKQNFKNRVKIDSMYPEKVKVGNPFPWIEKSPIYNAKAIQTTKDASTRCNTHGSRTV